MLLFWRHGYEGTSLKDLTTAMEVTPPSIYAAFGDKRGLFLEAVDRYLGGPITAERLFGGAATAREAARALLTGSAETFTGDATPAGCLLASAAITGSAESADVQRALSARRAEVEALLRACIEKDVAAGLLPEVTDADAVAAHIMAVVQGLSTLARDGAGRDKLMRVAEVAMRAWPGEQGMSD